MKKQDWINTKLNHYLNSEAPVKKGIFTNLRNNLKKRNQEEDLNIEMTAEGGVVVVENEVSLYIKLKSYLGNLFGSKKVEEETEENKELLKQ